MIKIMKSFMRPLKVHVTSLWWALKRVLAPARLPENADGKIFLHLGCGPINAKGFTNIDTQPLPHVHYVHGAFPLEMVGSESVDLVYASHILEHFSWRETESVLREWKRVLKVGGMLRLGVPDFSVLLQIYHDTGELGRIFGPLMGGQTDIYNYHYAVFDEESLRNALLSIGFQNVKSWSPDGADFHEFTDTTSNVWRIGNRDYKISLNIEAVK